MTLSLITHLVQSYGYYAVFTLIALESMGIPLPGETALITAALYAGTTHHLNVVALAAVATCAAVIGDNAATRSAGRAAYGWPSATDVTSAWTARNSRSGAICSPGMA